MRIAVVGSGYVGLVAGACFADLGHEVILVDNDERKLEALKNGQVPIHENFLPELLNRHRGQRLTFSDDLPAAVRASAAIFIAVGTPPTEAAKPISPTWSPWRTKFRRGQRLQSRCREKYGSGLHQPVDPENHPAKWRGPGILTSPRIRSSCAKVLPSLIFSIPTASSSESKRRRCAT